jgi:hypothetical protein
MSSLPRPNRNAAHTRAIGRRPAVSSDTNAPRNRGPTNWPSRQEFSRSPIQRSRDYRRTQTGSVNLLQWEQRNWLRGLDLNQRSRLRGGIMSLTSAALLEDETILARLFVALNGFPIFAPLKATTLHFAKQVSKDRVPLSNLIDPCCVVVASTRHRRIHQCKICLRDFEEHKRDKPPRLEKIGCGGWI